MTTMKKAVILAAGLGSRLRPLTDEIPKCLTEVNGRPILEHTLDILEKHGIDETVIVIGYLGDEVIKKLGTHYRNMNITYVWNKEYDDTNSMYSVWLCKKYIEQGALLIEGDTVFEEQLITNVLQTDPDKTYWVGDTFTRVYKGSMSITDEHKRIIDLKIIREELRDYKDNYFKSTGVLKITPHYGKQFSQWLEDEVQKGNTQVYFDLVIKNHLNDAPIYIYDFTGGIWNEIDSLEDLHKAEKNFSAMKYVILILDGAADAPLPELQNQTPLEAANIPNIDNLTKQGKTGLIRTMYPGLPVGSIVSNLGIIGYNPMRYYPNGRASFEALAQDIFLNEGDIAFRCNLVTLKNGVLEDFTAKNISDRTAKLLIDHLEIQNDNLLLCPGQSYRNLMVVRNVNCNASDFIAFEPHMNIGQPIQELLIQGTSEPSSTIADQLNTIMLNSIDTLKDFDKETVPPADMIYLWSPSGEPKLPSFHKKFNIDGAIVSGLDFMRGIGIAARMEAKKVYGATGYSDTNLTEKLNTVKRSLRYNDLVYLHINAPDEESHKQDLSGKIRIIEKVDKTIIGPLRQYLDNTYKYQYRIAILPDHYTLVTNGEHADNPVPYVVYGKDVPKDAIDTFSETKIGTSSKTIIKSYEFMDFFLKDKYVVN